MEIDHEHPKKKEWKTPELVILLRTNPEDSILEWCKEGSIFSKSPAQSDVARCQAMILACGYCQMPGPS